MKHLAVDDQIFFQLGEQDEPANRRLGGRHQQAVIAARVQSDDRGGSKTAETICLQPLAAKRRIEITACFLVELNHRCIPFSRRFPKASPLLTVPLPG